MSNLFNQRFTADLSTIERIQLDWYLSRFTQDYYKEYLFGHAILLAYAAVPAYLTPDLLYKMRQNFGKYTWGNKEEFVHSLAVSDILLSPFCREISHELFRMNENVRLALLRWMNSEDPMWRNCNPERIENIARFVKQYHEAPNEATVRYGEKYREEQDHEARFYFDSAEVAREYIEKLRNAKNNRDTLIAIDVLLKAKSKEDSLSLDQKHFSTLFTHDVLEMWKDALQENVESLSSRVSHEINNAEVRQLFDLKGDTARSTKVAIYKSEPAAVRQLDAMMPAKKIAVFIGLSPTDSPNCERMRATLEHSHIDPWENHFFTKPMSNRELESKLNDVLTSCTRYDHLLVYISIADAKGPAVSKNKMVGIIPKAHSLIESVFQNTNGGGVTVIYDGFLEQAPKINQWLTDGKVLFVSPQGNQPSRKSKKEVSEFTSMMCDAISKSSSFYTNRQLYAATISQYNNQKTSLKNAGPPVNSPILLCSRETCGYPFSRNRSTQDTVQRGLRLLGYCDLVERTEWVGEHEYALVQFAKEKQVIADVNSAFPFIDAEVKKQQQEAKPLFLLVFSDPNRQLSYLEAEINLATEALKNSSLNASVEIKIMHNRTLADVELFVRHADNRNRLQFVYYSGFDRNGNAVFTDGELTIDRWASWLSFHTQLDLVVFNTCRAALLAEQLAQIGVGMAIGPFGEISDSYGGYFADLFFKALASNQRIDSLPFSQIDQRV